jgi:hypothetical protein
MPSSPASPLPDLSAADLRENWERPFLLSDAEAATFAAAMPGRFAPRLPPPLGRVASSSSSLDAAVQEARRAHFLLSLPATRLLQPSPGAPFGLTPEAVAAAAAAPVVTAAGGGAGGGGPTTTTTTTTLLGALSARLDASAAALGVPPGTRGLSDAEFEAASRAAAERRRLAYTPLPAEQHRAAELLRLGLVLGLYRAGQSAAKAACEVGAGGGGVAVAETHSAFSGSVDRMLSLAPPPPADPSRRPWDADDFGATATAAGGAAAAPSRPLPPPPAAAGPLGPLQAALLVQRLEHDFFAVQRQARQAQQAQGGV